MSTPRKILFYFPALSAGGAERVQAVLAAGFAARGDEVVVAVEWDAPEGRHILGSDMRIHVLGRGHARGVARLRRIIQAEKPDVIVSALAYCNLKATLAAMAAGVNRKLVLTFHGYAVSENQRLSRSAYRLVPLLSRLTAATVAVSDGLESDLLTHHHASKSRTLRIYNPVRVAGVPDDLDARALRDRSPMVLAAGRLIPEKGFLTLIQAFASLNGSDARLVILGEGPQRSELEAEIARLGLQGRVDLPGFVAEPWSWFRQAACFVSASEMESFALVLVEAMAHGLPIVATRCGATTEVLGEDSDGRLVDVGDAGQMASAIAAALADGGDPRTRIARARQFSVEAALDEYSALFDRICGRSEVR